jgi:hypothetical protein
LVSRTACPTGGAGGGRGYGRARGRLGSPLRLPRRRCLLLFVDGDAEVRREAPESGVVSLSYGPEFPGALAEVELTEDERGLDGRVRALEARDLGAVGRVHDPHVEAGHPSEGAAVRRCRDHDTVDRRLHPREVHGEGVGDGTC